MERLQALYTMHELLTTLADHRIKKHIVIEPDPNTSAPTEKHVIKIKHKLDDETLKKIEPIAEKYKAKIEKMDDIIIIH